LAKLVKVGLVD